MLFHLRCTRSVSLYYFQYKNQQIDTDRTQRYIFKGIIYIARRKRGMERRKIICCIATHNDSGKHYIGIPKRGSKARGSQHERDVANKRLEILFHNAFRKYGKDAFTWEVVAEGEDETIKLLEHVLIERLGTNELGGFNAVGGYALPPIKDLEFDQTFDEHQRNVQLLDMLNDLDSIVHYCKEHPHMSGERLRNMRGQGMGSINTWMNSTLFSYIYNPPTNEENGTVGDATREGVSPEQ